MPIYEYLCEDCGREFEELVRSAGASREVACPKCGGRNVGRQVSVFAARQGRTETPPLGGCGRCGDPDGPCSL